MSDFTHRADAATYVMQYALKNRGSEHNTQKQIDQIWMDEVAEISTNAMDRLKSQSIETLKERSKKMAISDHTMDDYPRFTNKMWGGVVTPNRWGIHHHHFNLNLDPSDYEVVTPFTLADIFEKRPCRDQYMKLIKEREDAPTWFVRSKFRSLDRSQVLRDNINWLLEKGFVKERVTEVVVKPGDVLVGPLGKEYIIITDSDGDMLLVSDHTEMDGHVSMEGKSKLTIDMIKDAFEMKHLKVKE